MSGLQLLIAQVGTILVVARLLGWLFQKLHQPRVIGEMVAGILLGPSLLGWAAPDLSAALFPADSLDHLQALSQIGLLLFMFLIGLELDLKQLRQLGRVAIITSQVSILAPFLMGIGLALYLYPRLSDASVHPTGFALFMGAAMSITAFPVLARILAERNLLRTKAGIVALACAAVNDVTAWCLLAGIVVLIRASAASMPVWGMIAGLVLFGAVMWLIVRRGLQRLAGVHEQEGCLTYDHFALILLVVLAASWVTEALGIHALFGAFIAGVVMPRHHGLAEEIAHRFEAIVVVLLLPLYFAFTGLRSSFFLIRGLEMWLYCAVIIAVALIGKLGSSLIAARATGMTWREATAVGVLMNTRGLVELIILNVGLDLGILSPSLFSIMVLMALVTTFMTSPLIAWIYPQNSLANQID